MTIALPNGGAATVLAGDEDSFWHFSLYNPPHTPIQDIADHVTKPDHCLRAFRKLWKRQATFSGDVPPPEFEQAVRTGVEKLIEEYGAWIGVERDQSFY